MNFLNPDEQPRVKIHKSGDPGVVSKSAVNSAAAKTPAGAPKPVAAIVKTKGEPKVHVVEVEPGLLEVHFTCSCGEEYVIRCNSQERTEKSSEAPPAA